MPAATMEPLKLDFDPALSAPQPEWLAAERRAAAEAARGLEFPGRQEEAWRRTNPELFHPGDLTWMAGTTRVSLFGGEALPADLTAMSLSEAAASHESEVRRDLDSLAARTSVFTRLNTALWSAGGYVQLDRNQVLDRPLQLAHRFERGGCGFSRTLVRAGRHSQGVVVESFHSSEAETLAVPVVEVHLEAGARVDYVLMHQWGSQTRYLPFFRCRLEQDAHLRVLFVGAGGVVGKNFMEGDLEGSGSRSEMLGLVFGKGRQHLDTDALHNHNVDHTTSDVLFHVALTDRARSIFAGNIVVAPGAQKTDAYQANRNLLLSSKARADAMPKLEISANDVRCTHGATFATYDRDQQFYLRSRGLTKSEAEHLLVTGFYQAVYGRLEHEELINWLSEQVEAVLENALG